MITFRSLGQIHNLADAQIAIRDVELMLLQLITEVNGLVGSVVYDPPNLADGAGVTKTFTVTGARLGDYAKVTFSLDLQGIQLTAAVSATDTVAARFQNETGGAIDLGSGTLTGKVNRL